MLKLVASYINFYRTKHLVNIEGSGLDNIFIEIIQIVKATPNM